MKKSANDIRGTRLAVLLFIAVLLLAVLLIREAFSLLLPGLWAAFTSGDEQAISAYLSSQSNLYSFFILWLLTVVQVLSIVIPAMPVQLAAGIAYGPWRGFFNSFTASVAANMAVYLLARQLLRPLNRLVGRYPKIKKLLDSVAASKDPWFYTILAFITPGLPNGLVPYAAAQAHMSPKRFLAAILLSLPIPTLCTCAAGSLILAGDWTFSILLGILLYTVVGVLFWKREKVLALVHRTWNRRAGGQK